MPGNVVRVSRTTSAAPRDRAPKAKVGTRLVESRARRMLEALGFDGVELSIALVDDPTIRSLNKTYRKKDKPTDVLSFVQHDDALSVHEARRALGNGGGHGLLLGDVIVSLDTATRQAEERGRPLVAEVTTLLAHGILHLAGFDHPNDDEEREMNAYAAVLEAAASNRRPLKLVLRRRG